MSKISKAVALIAGIAMVLTFAVAPVAKADTTSDQIASLTKQVNDLLALIATLTGGSTTAPATTYRRDLTVGMTGDDVKSLQIKLGVTPTSGYFGPLTKAAVVKYQLANGLPGTGYFGPLTRQSMTVVVPVVNVPGTSTSTTGTTISGTDEGVLSVTTNPTPSAGVTIREGDAKASVLGLKVEAKQSDIRVDRIKIDLPSTTFYNKVASTIYVMDGSTVLASSPMNSSTVVKDGSDYMITLTGLNTVITKGTTKVLTIAVDLYPTISSTYLTSPYSPYTIQLADSGVRGVDGAGLQQYSPLKGSNVSRSINVSTKLTDAATLKISTSANTPVTQNIAATDGTNSNEIDNVTVLSFDLRADKDDITVTELALVVAKTGTGAATSSTAYLYDGSTLLGSASINTSTGIAYFDDLDFVVSKNTPKTITVTVDIDSADSTAAVMTASITNGTPSATVQGILAENNDAAEVVESGSATGNGLTVTSAGPIYTLVGTPTIVKGATSLVNNYSTSTVTATFNVKVKAVGADVQFGTTASGTPMFGTSTAYFKIYKNGSASTLLVASSTDFSKPSSGVVDNGTNTFTLQQGNEVTIPVTFSFLGNLTTGVALDFANYAVGLESIVSSYGSATNMAGLTTWRTSGVTLP